MPGCFLYHSFDMCWVIPATNGTAAFSTAVPNNPVLIGGEVYVQAAAGSVSSNAGELFFGNK